MMGRYKGRTENNRSRFYILLSIVFLIVMFKWGMPAFINLIAGNGVPRPNTESDVIPPQVPVLSAIPDATNSSSLVVEGYTEANVKLEFMVNDVLVQNDMSKDDGSFMNVVRLSAGSNRVQVKAFDAASNYSYSEVELVTFDANPVELTIASPKDGSEFFGRDNQTVEIAGKVSKSQSTLLINNSYAIIDKEGSFKHKILLQNGQNEVKIIVSDRAGNTAEKTIMLVYTP